MQKSKSGFTLIELLVVIAIIGLLATLSIVAVGPARARARDAKRLSDVKQIRTALELYYDGNGEYPAQTMLLSDEDPAYNTLYCLQDGLGFVQKPCDPADGVIFMDPVPLPPSQSDGACKELQDVGLDENISKNYYYYIKENNNYRIQFCLGTAVHGVSAGQHFITSGGVQ